MREISAEAQSAPRADTGAVVLSAQALTNRFHKGVLDGTVLKGLNIAAFVVVTHDDALTTRCGRQLRLELWRLVYAQWCGVALRRAVLEPMNIGLRPLA